MTDDMVQAAHELQAAARNYKNLYEEQNGKNHVVWIKNDETGEGVFISDSFNTDLIKSRLDVI